MYYLLPLFLFSLVGETTISSSGHINIPLSDILPIGEAYIGGAQSVLDFGLKILPFIVIGGLAIWMWSEFKSFFSHKK